MASSSATAPGQSAFKFLQRGAIIQEFTVAGQNIVLGFPDPKAYASHNSSYFGETIGRVANRVQDARLRKLNDRAYTLKANNGTSSLHGGLQGWGKKTWQGPTLGLRDGKESVTFQYQSIHGEEGYPGTVDARVNYAGSTRVEDGIEMTVLDVEYEVRMSENQPDGVDETVINVTNHSYFNLGNKPTIEGTCATLFTDLYLPLDANGIPKSGPEPHPTLKAKQEFVLGQSEPDFDNCFVLNDKPSTVPLDSRSLPLQTAASFHHPLTNLHLEVQTTEPAFQFYTGKYIDTPAVGEAPARASRAGFAVEPARYTNAINVDQWRGMVLLRRGEAYGSRMVYTAFKT